MSKLRRIVIVRHGETAGESSVRFHGSSDVELAPEGTVQMRSVAKALGSESFDVVVASPLQRSWRSAWIAGGGAPVRLEQDFREIDFGRWEGLTREEIQASDPVLFEDWQGGGNFEFPNGEARGDFTARVEEGLARVMASGAHSALIVVHKGVLKTIVKKLTGETMEADQPALGAVVQLTNTGDSWTQGRRGSNPPGLGEEAA